MVLSDWRRRATMDRVTLRRLIFRVVFIQLLLKNGYKSFYLIWNKNELYITEKLILKLKLSKGFLDEIKLKLILYISLLFS